MKLSKIKTDKSDSRLICGYFKKVDVKLGNGNINEERECFEITRTPSVYTKQSNMLKKQITW